MTKFANDFNDIRLKFEKNRFSAAGVSERAEDAVNLISQGKIAEAIQTLAVCHKLASEYLTNTTELLKELKAKPGEKNAS